VSRRLRLGASLACLGILATGIFFALTPPAPPGFDAIKTQLGDIRTEPIPGVDPAVDRYRYLKVSGAACSDYYYSDSWASSVDLPTLIDTNAGARVTIYVSSRACAGFSTGGHGRVAALLYADQLYATDEYLHPAGNRYANLPVAILLVAVGAAGLFLFWRAR